MLNTKIHIQTEKSWLATWDDYIPANQLPWLTQKLMSLPLEHRPPLQVYGREVHANRSIGFFSNDSSGYRYTGQITEATPLTPELTYILNNVNAGFKLISGRDQCFNGVLVNLYHTGADYIGAHSDREFDLLEGGYVVALSFGAERIFRVRSKIPGFKQNIITKSGQMLCMAGQFQSEFTHEIPKQLRVTEPRISLTFRYHTQ